MVLRKPVLITFSEPSWLCQHISSKHRNRIEKSFDQATPARQESSEAHACKCAESAHCPALYGAAEVQYDCISASQCSIKMTINPATGRSRLQILCWYLFKSHAGQTFQRTPQARWSDCALSWRSCSFHGPPASACHSWRGVQAGQASPSYFLLVILTLIS